jgi:cation:H+ antiporter
MLELILWIVIFIISIFFLVKSSDYFTNSAEKIGIYLGIPSFIVGVTIVSIGTSLPELISSIFAVLNGSSEIVIGNVVGSNIANIFLIIGISAIVARKLNISFELIHVDLPMLVGSAFLLALLSWDGIFSLADAILSLGGILIYLAYIVAIQKKIAWKKSSDKALVKEVFGKEKNGKKLHWQPIVILIVSAAFIFFSAKYTIQSIINISDLLNIGKELIAVTAVALGTSLPELMVSINAARKGNAEMAVGNILGSNIFNSFMVMGIPGLIGSLTIPASIISFGLPVMLLATLLYFFITQDKQITRWEGWLLILFYIFFIGKTFSIF